MTEEKKPLRVHGVPKPQGNSWLKEVRVDAARNIVEQLRRQEEKKQFEEAKARGITPEEIISKGKEDLHLDDLYDEEETNFEQAENSGFDQEPESESEEVAELKKQLKAARAAQTRAENKLKEKEDATPDDPSKEPAKPSEPETPSKHEEVK